MIERIENVRATPSLSYQFIMLTFSIVLYYYYYYYCRIRSAVHVEMIKN